MSDGASLSERVVEEAHVGAVIRVMDLEKTYSNGTKAVRGISFEVHRGEFYGILGPNGAGKSTTIGVLGTLVRPSAGRAIVDGIDVARHPMEIRKRIGFAMQDAGTDLLATGREFLRLQARLYGIDKATAEKRAALLLTLFELDDAADKRIDGYSGGMKRRVDLAAAMIHLPRILFLDEPTEGLDPRSRRTMWETLRKLNAKLGATVLLSTHYMEEADALCDRIAIVDRGVIVAQGTPEELKKSVGGQTVVLEFSGRELSVIHKAEEILAKSGLTTRMLRTGHELNAYTENAGEAAPKILRMLESGGIAPSSLRIQQPTLDDVYLKYTGRKLEEAEKKEVDA